MDKNNMSKNDMDKLYIFLVQTKEKDYEEFSRLLFRRTRMNVKEIASIIFENKVGYDEVMIKEMKIIMSYIVNKKLNKVSKELKSAVDKIKLKEIKEETTALNYPGLETNKQLLEMKRDASLKTTKEMLKDVFKKKYIDEENSDKLSRLVSFNLGKITDEEYLNFIKIKYGIDPISIENIELVEDVIINEINTVTNKLAMLEYYSENNDLEGIKSIEIPNQLYKSEEYQTSLKNVTYSKLRRLEHLQRVLLSLYDRIIKIKETKDCSNFEKLKSNEIHYLNENYPFLGEVYKQLDNTNRIYKTSVSDLKTVLDTRKDSLSKEFNKRFLLVNKEAQE